MVNIGRIDDKTGRERLEVLAQSLLKLSETVHLLNFDDDIEGKSSKQLGCELVFRRLFEDIGLNEILAKVFGIKKLRQVDKTASYRKTITGLKRLQAMTIKIHKTNVTTRTEINDDAKVAFKALNMAFPKKVLAHDNENLIAIRN